LHYAAVIQVFYLLFCFQDIIDFIPAQYARWHGRKSYGRINEKVIQIFGGYGCSIYNRLSKGM